MATPTLSPRAHASEFPSDSFSLHNKTRQTSILSPQQHSSFHQSWSCNFINGRVIPPTSATTLRKEDETQPYPTKPFTSKQYLPYWIMMSAYYLTFLAHNTGQNLIVSVYGPEGSLAVGALYICFFLFASTTPVVLNHILKGHALQLIFYGSLAYIFWLFSIASGNLPLLYVGAIAAGVAGPKVWVSYGVAQTSFARHISEQDFIADLNRRFHSRMKTTEKTKLQNQYKIDSLIKQLLLPNGRINLEKITTEQTKRLIVSTTQNTAFVSTAGWVVLTFNTISGGLIAFFFLNNDINSTIPPSETARPLFIFFTILTVIGSLVYYLAWKSTPSTVFASNNQPLQINAEEDEQLSLPTIPHNSSNRGDNNSVLPSSPTNMTASFHRTASRSTSFYYRNRSQNKDIVDALPSIYLTSSSPSIPSISQYALASNNSSTVGHPYGHTIIEEEHGDLSDGHSEVPSAPFATTPHTKFQQYEQTPVMRGLQGPPIEQISQSHLEHHLTHDHYPQEPIDEAKPYTGDDDQDDNVQILPPQPDDKKNLTLYRILLNNYYLLFVLVRQRVIGTSLITWAQSSLPANFVMAIFTTYAVKPTLGQSNSTIVIILVAFVNSISSIMLAKFMKTFRQARMYGLLGTCIQLLAVLLPVLYQPQHWGTKTTAWIMAISVGALVGLGDSMMQSGTNAGLGMVAGDVPLIRSGGFSWLQICKGIGFASLFLCGRIFYWISIGWIIISIVLISIAAQAFNWYYHLPIDVELVMGKYDAFVNDEPFNVTDPNANSDNDVEKTLDGL